MTVMHYDQCDSAEAFDSFCDTCCKSLKAEVTCNGLRLIRACEIKSWAVEAEREKRLSHALFPLQKLLHRERNGNLITLH